jgi:D-beta-D-heptose 7-phosphate kinase/D-beta-D-heptose 1-phosphate adenosyltransferase
MPKILVTGDLIADIYRMHNSTRLCPEAPVPVLVAQKLSEQGTRPLSRRDGGAGLVAAQLRQLIGCGNVRALFGSRSEKERIFADGKLICRIDRDSIDVVERKEFHTALATELLSSPDLIIVSDYGKGAMDAGAASLIHTYSKVSGAPVLVDAKKSWHWYEGAFAFFPNKHEPVDPSHAKHIIQKLGERGCAVDGVLIGPVRDHEVRDATGAGDTFVAAFGAYLLQKLYWEGTRILMVPESKLAGAARYANKIAGQSVEHLGTYIVPEKLDIG